MRRNQNQPAIMHLAPTTYVAFAELNEKDGPVVIAMPGDRRSFFLPGINPDKSQSSVHRGQCESQKCLRLLYTEHSHFEPSDTRQLQSFSRHFQNHFPTQCLPERRIQDPVSTLGRPRREPTI